MGFLNGAYGKLMAGKLVRDLQYQMTGIQSQLRRVTRQVGDMESAAQDVLVKTGKNAIKLLDVEVQGTRLKGSEIGEFFKMRKVMKLT